MCERYFRSLYKERGRSEWLYYHFKGEDAVRQICVNNVTGEVVKLGTELPVVGNECLYDQPFKLSEWQEEEPISKEEFEQVWENLGTPYIVYDTYVKTSNIGVDEIGMHYIHYHGWRPKRQVSVYSNKRIKLTKDNRSIKSFVMFNQPLCVLSSFGSFEYISNEEFEAEWKM